MYASVTRSDPAPGASTQDYSLDRLGGSGRLQISLFEQPPNTDEVYEVEADQAGSSDQPPTVATVLTFAGPISPAHKAAAEFAGQQRIAPVMAVQPGLVRVLVLWNADRRSQVVVLLFASLAELETAGKLVATMDLLPGEDPALLSDPDTMEIYRVQPQPAEAGAR